MRAPAHRDADRGGPGARVHIVRSRSAAGDLAPSQGTVDHAQRNELFDSGRCRPRHPDMPS